MTRWMQMAAVAVVTCAAITAAAAPLPVPAFTAHYTIYGKGLPLGEGLISLAANGANGYRMRSEVQPTGLAALLVDAKVDENATGTITGDNVQPTEYRQVRTDKDGTETIGAAFDWQQFQVDATVNDQATRLPVREGVVDPLSLHLKVMMDLKRDALPDHYSFIDDDEIKTYSIRLEGEETLETPLGDLRTVKISQNRPGNSRITSLWFAPELDYLPVQIRQEKKGKEVLRMEIKSVDRSAG